MINKFQYKLASWKRDSLNQAGRLSLIKSTLDSLPIYWFSLHKVHVGVCKQLEKIRRDFFWGNVSEEGGIYVTSNPGVCYVSPRS